MSKLISKIVEEEIRPEKVIDFISNSAHGAQLTFFGKVRDHNEGKRVSAVDFDVCKPVAEKQLSEICEEALELYAKQANIIAIHRVGNLKVGECSIAIGVSSAHRKEAYEASRYIIEQIKKRLAIWKKEIYSDGKEFWLDGVSLKEEAKRVSNY